MITIKANDETIGIYSTMADAYACAITYSKGNRSVVVTMIEGKFKREFCNGYSIC